jgi:sulfite exporter TauE/SafE
LIALFSGLTAGLIHVFSGPDHLAAIAPLSLTRWKKAVAIGFRWGLGHSSGVLFVGLLALLFRELIPVEAISSWGERLVGVMLIGIGIWGLKKCLGAHLHQHAHSHDGDTHVHYHVHAHGHGPREEKPHQHTHAAFAVGTVHGVAGSSHFFGVLPALVFADRLESITYLTSFGIGTILAMMIFSAVFGWLGKGLRWNVRYYKLTGCTISASAIGLGLYWLIAS